jgi:hypothetical protein
MLRCLAEAVLRAGYVPETACSNGISDTCSEVEELAAGVKGTLDGADLL